MEHVVLNFQSYVGPTQPPFSPKPNFTNTLFVLVSISKQLLTPVTQRTLIIRVSSSFSVIKMSPLIKFEGGDFCTYNKNNRYQVKPHEQFTNKRKPK